MKKLFLVLLVVTIVSLLFTGCLPVTPSEGEGEGECEVTVVIEGAVMVDGKTYVSAGNHDITVTFCSPIAGYADAYITCCTGDYSKLGEEVVYLECGSEVVLFPNADKTIWTGSGYFGCSKNKGGIKTCSPCCASYVEIYAGECEDEACIWFPVIVDYTLPYAEIAITVDECTCEGCELAFTSISTNPDCAESEECCGDICSGLASWAINLYDGIPFDDCCDPSVCEEPISRGSGVCPIDFTTECLDAGTYYVVVNLVDKVGLEKVYYARIVISVDGLTEDCDIDVYQGYYVGPDQCVVEFGDTTDTIGACTDV